MSELSTTRPGSRRSLRVDLTPMVDLGFLLISFFIFTTTLTEQKAANFYLPADGEPTLYSKSTSLTLVPGANNKIWYFDGILEEAIAENRIRQTGYALRDGIGNVIRAKQQQLAAQQIKDKLSILICPSPSSSYGNVVDLVDEMLINRVKVYTISDDKTLLQGMASYLAGN